MKAQYTIDFAKKTLTISKEFEDNMQDISSEEYALYTQLLSDIPGITVLRRTHKTPTKYVNKDKEKFYCNQFKNLKFERMEKFMSSLPNGDEYKAQYEFLRYYAGEFRPINMLLFASGLLHSSRISERTL